MGAVFWRAITFTVENETVGVMPESVDGGRAEESVGERVSPLRKIKIAGDKGGCALMPFGNKVVQVLILGRPERLEP